MRRAVLAAFLCLGAAPLAFADFDHEDRLGSGPPVVDEKISEGTLLPPAIPLLDIPAGYTEGYGIDGGYRYAVIRGAGVLVDPVTRRVMVVLP